MIIDYAKLDTMSPDEIENLKVEMVKEMQLLEEDKFLIRDHYNKLRKDRIILDGMIHDYLVKLSQASHVIKQKQSDISILESKFWRAKRG